MTWRARHLRPAHHQVPLTILLLSHRHQRTPLQARTPENQTMPTSSREDFVNGLLSEILASPPVLRGRLDAIAPASIGLTKGRGNNVRSLLRKALKISGIAVMPGRHLNPLSADWSEHMAKLPTRTLKIGLSRLAHFCSDAGVARRDVNRRPSNVSVTPWSVKASSRILARFTGRPAGAGTWQPRPPQVGRHWPSRFPITASGIASPGRRFLRASRVTLRPCWRKPSSPICWLRPRFPRSTPPLPDIVGR